MEFIIALFLFCVLRIYHFNSKFFASCLSLSQDVQTYQVFYQFNFSQVFEPASYWTRVPPVFAAQLFWGMEENKFPFVFIPGIPLLFSCIGSSLCIPSLHLSWFDGAIYQLSGGIKEVNFFTAFPKISYYVLSSLNSMDVES